MILDRLFETRATSGIVGHPRDPALADWLGAATNTSAGVPMDEERALGIATVYACVRCISETVGMLPLFVYERQGEDKAVAASHPLYPVLHDAPNPEQTSMIQRTVEQARLLLWGNSYSEIERDGAGRVVALWPIHPRRVRPGRGKSGRIFYEIAPATDEPRLTERKTLAAEDMLHVPGMPLDDGIVGASIVRYARESFGHSAAQEQFGSTFFGNGARFSGSIEVPGRMSPEAYKRLKEANESMSGPGKAHKIKILEEGAKYSAIGVPPEDAQFLESRKFSAIDVCRWFRVQPHKIFDLERATFSNIEEQNRDFVQDAAMPWLVRWQQAYVKLFSPSDRRRYFAEHLIEGLLRGDILKRYQAYSTGRQWGWLNVNEIRRLENMNGIGDQGEMYLVPANMTDAAKLGEEPPPDPEPDPEPTNKPAADAARAVFDRQLERMLFKARLDAGSAARLPDKFMPWLDGYRAKYEAKLRQALAPAAAALRALGIEADENAIAAAKASTLHAELLEIAGNSTAGNLLENVTRWTEGDGNADH